MASIQTRILWKCLAYQNLAWNAYNVSLGRQEEPQEESMQTDTTRPSMVPKEHYYSLNGDIDYTSGLTKEQAAESMKVQEYYARTKKTMNDLLSNE